MLNPESCDENESSQSTMPSPANTQNIVEDIMFPSATEELNDFRTSSPLPIVFAPQENEQNLQPVEERDYDAAVRPREDGSPLQETPSAEDARRASLDGVAVATDALSWTSVSSARKQLFFPDFHLDQAPIFDFGEEEETDFARRWEFDPDAFEVPQGAIDANESLKSIHVFSMKAQGNLYSMASVSKGEVGSKLLTACLSRPVYVMEFASVDDVAREGKKRRERKEEEWNGEAGSPVDLLEHMMPSVRPRKQEIKFTYIPAGADIISMDSFSRKNAVNDYIIGITFAKLHPNESGIPVPSGQYLNVYSEWISPSTLENLSESCLSIELDFLPYHLTHCDVPVQNPKIRDATETVFLLAGSDERIHLYVEDRQAYMFVEVDVRHFFPELLGTFPSVPIWIDVKYLDPRNSRRLSAVGCECGTVILSSVDCSTNPPTIINTWKDTFGEGLVNSVILFHSTDKTTESPSMLKKLVPNALDENEFEYILEINLLVVCSFSPARVFRNVMKTGLSDFRVLQGSDRFDVPTCAVTTDVDLDGKSEILLGTFGQELLVYKEVEEDWQLIWTRSFSHPIHALKCIDLTGDGVKELAVMTSKGVHVLQHDMQLLKKVRVDRLRSILDTKPYCKTRQDQEDYNER